MLAFAVWGGTIGGMAALGPLVGGWLTTYASWHWAFLINVPIGIVVLVGVLMLVPETKELGGPKGLDVPGTIPRKPASGSTPLMGSLPRKAPSALTT